MSAGLVNKDLEITMKPAAPRWFDIVCILAGPVIVIVVAVGLVFLIISARDLFVYQYVSQILFAAGIAVLSAVLGSLAMVFTWRNWPEYLPQGVLAAVTIRLITTMAGVLVVSLIIPDMRKIFFLSTAGFYILGLIIETILAIKVFHRGYAEEKKEE